MKEKCKHEKHYKSATLLGVPGGKSFFLFLQSLTPLSNGNLQTPLITEDILGYAISLPVGFHSVSTMNNTPNAIGVAATGYILKRVGGDTIVALYGIASGVLHINRYNNSSSTWLGWLTCVTNTDLGGAVFKTASGNIQYGMNGIYLGRFANGPLQSDGDSFAACIYLIGTGAGQTAAYVFPITQYSEGHLLFNRMGYDSLWELTNWKKLIA